MPHVLSFAVLGPQAEPHPRPPLVPASLLPLTASDVVPWPWPLVLALEFEHGLLPYPCFSLTRVLALPAPYSSSFS